MTGVCVAMEILADHVGVAGSVHGDTSSGRAGAGTSEPHMGRQRCRGRHRWHRLLGEDVSSLRANPRNHQITKVDHGWTVASSAKYVYQGSTNTGTFGKPNNKPVIYGYRCTASTLTWLLKGKVNDVETRVSNKP